MLVEANDTIPADGEVIEGVASVNESAVTGESAPVLREAGGDFSSVTGGTRVLSDWLVVRVTSREGEGFLDRMIAMVEGAKRGRTPNEIALSILLAMLTIMFLLATATLAPFSHYAVASAGEGTVVTVTVLVALLVCLIPTTIGGLLSAIGIAGMDRMVRANVIATSGRAVEAAGDVDVLLLDKTGTITLGDRQATVFHPAPRVDGARARRRGAARVAGRRDARGALDRRAREAAVSAARPRHRVAAAHVPQVLGADAHERRRRRGPQAAQGRGRRDPAVRRSARAARGPPRSARPSTRSRATARRRSSSPRRQRRARARRHRAARRRQRRHPRALRGAAPDGHQDRHGHGRQPPHRRGDRGRGRRRRVPRRGDARERSSS